MSTHDGYDTYIDAESGLLKNKRGLKDAAALSVFEASSAAVRSVELQAKPVKGNFDLDHFKETHRRLFQDVYDWAGQIRTVEIAKGNQFAHHGVLEPFAHRLFDQLKKEGFLQGHDAESFATRAAHYMSKLNILHMFREGNGRTQRAFIRDLANNAGYALDWAGVTKDMMTTASKRAFEGDNTMLADLILGGLKKRPQAQVEREEQPDKATLRDRIQRRIAKAADLSTIEPQHIQLGMA
jgi:cell filamentation protein